MQEIKCPKCGEIFQVDESGYAQIVQQVRDAEFAQELERRKNELEQSKQRDLELVKMEQEQKRDRELAKKDSELSEKLREIERLKLQLEKADTEKQLAVTNALREKEQELSDKNDELTKLESALQLKEQENRMKESNLLEMHRGELKLRDEEIERLKDFKLKQSTKMVGEDLEQYCLNQFNQLRMTAFPNAYFEKDNLPVGGTKGDFIFRESEGDTEYISIMFEMKNEMDATESKHKNADFFAKLDKDRNTKKCEYAVLVSMLESDSDYYNSGIVDVSYQYPKMYVIRPQFFIPIISLLRNAAKNSLQYQQELQVVKNQQMDFWNFEKNLDDFKTSFSDSFRRASERYDDAIKNIDKAITALTAVRDNLVKSENHLNAANNKLEGVSVKKLTKNADSVREMFDQIRETNRNETEK